MESKRVTIEVYNLYGKLIELLYYGNIEKDVNYNFENKPQAYLKNGIYIVKFVMDNVSVYTKNLMLER